MTDTAHQKHWDRDTALQEIAKCEFECQGGPLEGNQAFVWLKKALEIGPKFLPGQGVLAKVTAEVAGKKLQQEVHFYVVGVTMDSDQDSRFWKYNLSYDPPGPWHYGTVHLSNVSESSIRIPTELASA